MDPIIDSIIAAYQDFMAAAADVLEARESSSCFKTPAMDVALESLKQRWEIFKVSCDQAEELFESLKKRVGSESIVDEATGSTSTYMSGSASIPPINALRLQQMSKTVRSLVTELQHGSSSVSGPSSLGSIGSAGSLNLQVAAPGGAPSDERFSDDAAH